MARLSKNDVIEVHGWVMLKNMEDGQRYVIAAVHEPPFVPPGEAGRALYILKRVLKSAKLSTKTGWCHYVDSIDNMLGDGDIDQNYIEHLNYLTYCSSSGKVICDVKSNA